MKLKKYVLGGIAILSLGVSFQFNQTNAQASSWHSSSIPAHLRGYWRAKQNQSTGVHIYRHTIHYLGSGTLRHVQWKYAGNHYYKFRDAYDTSEDFSYTLHYYDHHRMTMNSFWHYYIR
ncbi:hypothetical protein [Secundilactobacillus silagei]|uniref:Uncharacterized protein n=1 Tax=Secundilactobacillus silagei JCM 19001 TaxID=1302250 RepID=A0A1Z5IJP4_9LACO|nr:hypothetical protein [Secundilactobacillus silagei]TDG68635.1 hypothetical protein C5L25_001711 [Secundilactobacillus silagei JCM 19001]GAX01916.1 hypothetical protein IWT126_01980 [Secundilactobacillus silagei JCM 19001]